jgi:tetraacyldisaccharide 4'-kinase
VIETALQRIWYAQTSPSWWLRLLEQPFKAVVAARRRHFAQGSQAVTCFEVPVVVIGNLSVGGTGKTPVVIELARALVSRGVRCGVITRGYGGRRGGGVALLHTINATRQPDPALHGDEPALIARSTGVLVAVGVDRVAAAAALIERGVDIVLSDDGLQHYRLGRSLEIAVVDGARGLGNAHLLPAGPLREPPARLREVDWIIVNGTPSSRCLEQIGQVAPSRDLLRFDLVADDAIALGRGGAEPVARRPLASFAGAPVHAVAGIGHPARFFAMLRAAGLEVIEHPFADHHRFVASDLAFTTPGEILMTEKDGVKCERLGGVAGWQVPVRAQFEPAGWEQLLLQIEAQARAPEAASGG